MGKINFARMVASADAVEFKKRVDDGDFDEMSKADWHKLISDGAEPSRAAGETRERAYTKVITGDSLGREIFRAYQNCEGGVVQVRFRKGRDGY